MPEGSRGVTRAKNLYRDRFRRAKELKGEGRKMLMHLDPNSQVSCILSIRGGHE